MIEEHERIQTINSLELLSFKEAKAFINASSVALQLTRLRKFDQGRDVYRVTMRLSGMTFDALTPGKAVIDALLYDLSIYNLTGKSSDDMVSTIYMDRAFEKQAKRIARKASRHQRPV